MLLFVWRLEKEEEEEEEEEEMLFVVVEVNLILFKYEWIRAIILFIL